MEMRAQEMAEEIIGRFTVLSQRRDKVLADSRQVVRRSANSIRASHRGEMVDAERELATARELASGLMSLSQEHPEIYWAGYVQDALKEVAEATIVLRILRDGEIPAPGTVGVEDAAWLNGLAEAGSELRRDVLDLLRTDETERAVSLLELMDEIYAVLVTIDFPDAITGGLRRTTDAFRAVIERTRGDVTMTLNQRRLEAAIREFEQRREA
jgi:translin